MRFALSTLLCLALVSPALAAPANQVGEILAKAKAADGFARLPREAFFEGGRGKDHLVFFELRRSGEVFKLEFVEFHGKKQTWKGERCTFGFDGQIRSMTLAKGKSLPPQPKPADTIEGAPKDGKLVFKTGAGEEKPELSVELEGNLVPMPVALFVLPAYAELLPDELSLTVLTEGETLPMTLRKGSVGKDRQELVLKAQGVMLEIKVAVSTDPSEKGKLVHLEVAGQEKKLIPAQEAKQRLMTAMRGGGAGKGEQPKAEAKGGSGHASPKAAVEALIKACQAKDLKAAGACFSPAAPKEFQSLRDGSCPPKMFAQLCDMFAKATIDGETMGKDGKSCAVAVTLSTRKETLNMVKGPSGWLILDF